MDVGAPEVGLIATDITTLARPGPKESHRGGDHSSDSSRGFFSGRQSMIQPFSGLAEDLILSVSSTTSFSLRRRGRKRLGVQTATVRGGVAPRSGL